MPSGSLSTRPWASRANCASRSRSREDVPREGRAGGEKVYRRPGRRNHAPDRRTYAFASAIPVRAPGAPIHDDERPRADLSVATVGRGFAGGRVSTMVAAAGHHPCGIQTSTTGAVRIPVAPAVRRVRRAAGADRRGCAYRAPRAAAGSVPRPGAGVLGPSVARGSRCRSTHDRDGSASANPSRRAEAKRRRPGRTAPAIAGSN